MLRLTSLYLLTFELNYFAQDPRHAYSLLKHCLRTMGAVQILLNQYVLKTDRETAASLL